MPFDIFTYLDETFRNVIRSREDLHDYQNEAVEWLKNNPNSALYIDVGMGKTITIETLLDWLLAKGYQSKILVIGPIKVINTVWAVEHTLWSHTAWLSVFNLRVENDDRRLKAVPTAERAKYKERLRLEALDNKSRIHLINQEAVAWLVSQFAEKRGKKVHLHRDWPYQIVIFDEATRLRDHSSQVFISLKMVRSCIHRFHELTATPSAQTYLYLFSQVWLLDKGKRFGSFITHFRERYFTQNPWSSKWTLRPDADVEIEKKMADICFVLRDDQKEQPIIHERPVLLTPKLRRQYDQFQDTFVLSTPNRDIEATNSGALSMKLLQLASGAVYHEGGGYEWFHDAKIDALAEIVEQTLDEPVLVAYWFKSSLDRLQKAFPKAKVLDRQGKAIATWNAGKHKIMLVHPQSAGHGIQLQFGGHHLVVFDMFWSLELFLQLVGRLARQGQLHRVIVQLLTVRGTVDVTVSRNLEILNDAQNDFFNRLRELHAKREGGFR